MTMGTVSENVPRRIQFLSDEAVSINDSFEFGIQRARATVFAFGAAFKIEMLMADVAVEDAVAANWKQVATDADTFAFDGSAAGTTVRVLGGPGYYRLVATANGANVWAGVDYPVD